MRHSWKALLPAGLGAMLSLGLLLGSAGTTGHAQTPSVSTVNLEHQLTFKYPSTWYIGLNSDTVPEIPWASPFDTNTALDLYSPNHAVEVYLSISGNSGSALTDLQSLIGQDAGDSAGHPNFHLLTAAAPISIPNTSDAATADYEFTTRSGGTVNHLQLIAAWGPLHYQLDMVISPASALQTYKDQLAAIQQSLQFLPFVP